jgi:hypothetical protein
MLLKFFKLGFEFEIYQDLLMSEIKKTQRMIKIDKIIMLS